jgi:site-specific recombinase XerC
MILDTFLRGHVLSGLWRLGFGIVARLGCGGLGVGWRLRRGTLQWSLGIALRRRRARALSPLLGGRRIRGACPGIDRRHHRREGRRPLRLRGSWLRLPGRSDVETEILDEPTQDVRTDALAAFQLVAIENDLRNPIDGTGASLPARRMLTGVGKLVSSKVYKPNTANGWLAIMRVIMKAAVAQFELERDPMLGIKDFDKALHRTYTEEEPNALLAREARTFMRLLRERWPQHFAFVALGLALGHRPSTLRPLRRKGSTPDYLAQKGVLLVRRSHTRGAEVLDATKTKRDQHIELPREMIAILDWHIKTQLTTDAMKESDLLFPAEDGGFRSPSNLRKAFADAKRKMKLAKHITPRALRRTFQDLTRAAHVDGVIAKAISGHATDAMRVHYSTAAGSEVRAGIAKVISLAGFKEARRGRRGQKAGA